MRKIRILYSGESTGAASGFGIYGHNILSRLVKNPKFEIAEFASFGSINDGKYKDAKWRYYPNAVDQGHPEFDAYNKTHENKYGAWRFERVLLDFLPDIVFTIRDPWMMQHEHRSPLRQFYHLAIMPTVDSAPQQHSWIEMFSSADAVFTYSDWAIPILKKQSNNKIKPICSAYPGTEFDAFFPSVDKAIDKQKLGLPADSFIIGSVMRNQKRKLLEDLFSAFALYLKKYGNTEKGKKTYLLIHTSYPDFAGWNIPFLIKSLGISSRVYFTYLCQNSNQIVIRKFSGAKAYSPYTNTISAGFPNVGKGVTRYQLGDIYRCMDLYVQYAICEGLGMPQVEAAACGVPIASVDYSAMSDVVEKTKGFPIKTAKMFYEWETNAYRAFPDNDYASDIFYKVQNLNPTELKYKQEKSRNAAEKYFCWDKTAKIWSDHFESVVLKGNQGNWDIPITLNNLEIPEYNEYPQMNTTQYVEWLCTNVAKTPELFYRYFGIEMIEQLNNGVTSPFKSGQPINRKMFYEMCSVIGQNKINCEQARVNRSQLQTRDFIEFAHMFEKGIK